MTRPGLLLFVWLWGTPLLAVPPDPKSLAIPPEQTLRARDLIAQLGSDLYAERVAAQHALAEMGRLARPALTDAYRKATDPEIRRRVADLLPRATDDDLKARVAVFLADTEGKFEHRFPGWTTYRKLVGPSKGARSLFADMIQDHENLVLLAALDGPAEDRTRRLAVRRQQVWQGKYPRTPRDVRREPTLPDLATLVLAETLTPPQGPTPGVSTSSMLTNTNFLREAPTGPRADAFKALLGRWVLSRKDAAFLYQALMVANRHQLKEAGRCAAMLLEVPRSSVHYRGTAITTLAVLGDRHHLPALESCLDDEVVLTRARMPGTQPHGFVEVRIQDTALAAALLVTAQKPEDYGFMEWTPLGASSRSRYLTLYMPAESRGAAFEKWYAWRKTHPDAEKPK